MNKQHAEQLVNELMALHGVGHIKFSWMKTRRMLGCIETHHIGRTINYQLLRLSAPYVERNTEESVRDTILHEIAHLLAGVHNGHNSVWQAKCIEIGAKPSQYANEAEKIVGFTYQVQCAVCETVFKKLFRRSTKDYSRCSCPKCGYEKSKGMIECVQITQQGN